MLRWLLAADAALMALGYGLGPPEWWSSGTLAVIRALPVPMSVWAALFGACAVLLLIRVTPFAGYLLGSALYSFWGLGLGATLITGELSAWGGPVHVLTVVAPLHVWQLWEHTRHWSHERRAA